MLFGGISHQNYHYNKAVIAKGHLLRLKLLEILTVTKRNKSNKRKNLRQTNKMRYKIAHRTAPRHYRMLTCQYIIVC
jgi:hypothetical protein